MATGGLARGFLLKGGRQGIFTAGNVKLQASATRTSDGNEEREKPSDVALPGPFHIQGPGHTTGLSQTKEFVQTKGPDQTKGPNHTEEQRHPPGPIKTTGIIRTKGLVYTEGPDHPKRPVYTKGPAHTKEPVHPKGPVVVPESQPGVESPGVVSGVNASLGRVKSEPLDKPLAVNKLSEGSTALQQPFHTAGPSAEQKSSSILGEASDLGAREGACGTVVARGIVEEAAGSSSGEVGLGAKTPPKKGLASVEHQSEGVLPVTAGRKDFVGSTESVRNEASIRCSEGVRMAKNVGNGERVQDTSAHSGLQVPPPTEADAPLKNDVAGDQGSGMDVTETMGPGIGTRTESGTETLGGIGAEGGTGTRGELRNETQCRSGMQSGIKTQSKTGAQSGTETQYETGGQDGTGTQRAKTGRDGTVIRAGERSPLFALDSAGSLHEGVANEDASRGLQDGSCSARGDSPGRVASVSGAWGIPAGDAKVRRAVCEIEEVFEPGDELEPRQKPSLFADVKSAQPTRKHSVRSTGNAIPPRTLPTTPLGEPKTLSAAETASRPSSPDSLDQDPSTSPDPPPPLPPEVVSFLLGWSPTPGLRARKPKPSPNPFEPTPPGWNAELSLASAVARDDVATRFLNLPTPAMQSVFENLPVSTILNCQMVAKAWHDRFSADPKLWASVDLSPDERLRHVADDELLGKLLDRSRDRHGTSYLTSVDVTGCENVTAGGLMEVMKHRGFHRLRAHGSGAQLPVYFAKWLADADVDAHVDIHTDQRAPRLGMADVAYNRSTWQDVIRLLSGSTRVVICGFDIRFSMLPFPSNLAVPFLQALYAAANLQTLRIGCAFQDRALLRDIAYVLDARRKGGWKGLEVLELEGLRGEMAAGTWEAVFGLLGGSDCQIRRLSVKDCHMGEAGSTALAAHLSENTSLREMEVSDCALDAAVWARLAEALLRNESVSKLTVGGWGWKGAKAETGPSEESILELIPDDDGVGFLGAAIAQSTALEVAHITAWGGATVLDSTGRVADLSPGFAHLLKELGGLDPATSRLECIVVEYDEWCLGDRGRSGALCVGAMIGYVLAGKGVRVVTANSAKMRPGNGDSIYAGVGRFSEVPLSSSPAREPESISARM